MEVVQDKFTDSLWYLHQSKDSGEGGRCCQDKKNRCKGTDRFHKNRPDIMDLDTLVYKQTDDQRVEYRDNGGLSRRSNTGINTSEDDDRT